MSHVIEILLEKQFQIGCSTEPLCYCPLIGDVCEYKRYSILLNDPVSKLNLEGNHYRSYSFKIRAENNASLVKSHRIDILMNNSGIVCFFKWLHFQFQVLKGPYF